MLSEFFDGTGLERAAPVHRLVQKLRAGEQFLARGKVHGHPNAPVWVWTDVHLLYSVPKFVASYSYINNLFVLQPTKFCGNIFLRRK